MNDYFRCFIIFCGYISVFLASFGLEAATYDGEFKRIFLDRVNLSSIDVRGTSVFSGPSLVPKTYNLPVTISAARLASLAKGALRGGLYGMMIQAAMDSAGWVWDDVLKNWTKRLSGGPSKSCYDYPPVPIECPVGGPFKTGGETPDAWCVLRVYVETPPNHMHCVISVPEGYGPYGPSCDMHLCGVSDNGYKWYFKGLIYYKELDPPPPTDIVVSATDQDIFDDAVKPNSTSVIPNILIDLPDVLNTPLSQLDKAANIVKINVPEIVTSLNKAVRDLNKNVDVQNAIDKIFKEGEASLTDSEKDLLRDNQIVPSDIKTALDKVVSNTPLTESEKKALDKVKDIQAVANSNLTSNTAPAPEIKINIPTDCDLIPFVCNWLTWFKGWMTESPPPIPNASVPIKDLDGFNLWATDTSGSCPSPNSIVVFGKTVQISYQPFCDLAVLIAPLLVALGWFYAAYIVLRV